MKKLILSALLAVFPLYVTTAQTDADLCALMDNHATAEEVAALIGQPQSVVHPLNAKAGLELWTMGNGLVIVFENGEVSAFYSGNALHMRCDKR